MEFFFTLLYDIGQNNKFFFKKKKKKNVKREVT
jgi:hypothetical protein